MRCYKCVKYAFLMFVSLFTLVGCGFITSTYKSRTHDTTPIEKGSPRYRIMGKGGVSEGAMVKYLREYNRKISQRKAVHIVRTYVEESSREGINHDVAFIQMCHETDFLRFSGTVSPSQNNFCGLGTVSESVAGYFFPNIRTGIRAHIQHLKAYASSESLANRCVDPRFKLVRRNSASDIFELTGKWAADKRYGELLKKKMDCLIDMENAHRRQGQSLHS